MSVTLNDGLVNRADLNREMRTNLEPEEHLLVREGDIAYNMMRMWQGAFGRAAYSGMVSPAYVVLRPKKTVDSRCAEYSFKRPRSIHNFWAYSYGLTEDRLRLYAPDCLRISAHFPPLPEQRKIADFLTAVDGRIQQLRQKKARLEDYKKGVMQQLFTQALRFKDDHCNDFPDWEERALGNAAAKIERGRFSPRPRNNPIYYGGDIPWVQTGDVVNSKGRIRFFSQTLNEKGLKVSKLFPKGTILITIAANIGYAGILELDMACPDSLIGITCGSKLNNQFVTYFLETEQPKMHYLAVEGAQKNINIDFLVNYPIRIPSLPEQTKIANFLTALDRKIESVSSQISHTRAFKKGLLQQMFV